MLDNNFYLTGGDGPVGSPSEVWEYSDDPTNPGDILLTKVNVSANTFTGRQQHSSAVLSGALYVIGGRENIGGTWTVRNDIWKSTDKGRNWSKVGVDNAQVLGA